MDAKRFFSDLRNINPNNPGGWPWPIKIFAFVVMFIAVIAAGFFFDWQDQLQAYSRAQDQEKSLKDTFLSKKSEAVNLDLIRKQLLDTQQSFGALLKQLPNKSEMDALLTDINQAGLGRGLEFLLFKPGNEIVRGVLTEQPISIKVQGDYDDLGKFASDISQLPRIVNLADIDITPTQHGLTMSATAKTYRYRDENESAAQKRPGAKR
jgi:type IV pilus assembly protein PilO